MAEFYFGQNSQFQQAIYTKVLASSIQDESSVAPKYLFWIWRYEKLYFRSLDDYKYLLCTCILTHTGLI